MSTTPAENAGLSDSTCKHIQDTFDQFAGLPTAQVVEQAVELSTRLSRCEWQELVMAARRGNNEPATRHASAVLCHIAHLVSA